MSEPRPDFAAFADDDASVYPRECSCHACVMPPCSWCLDGGYYDADGRPVSREDEGWSPDGP